ncbi:MAG: Protein C33G8.2, partial [Microgenomates group bacterium GW2011_GWF2_47_9]
MSVKPTKKGKDPRSTDSAEVEEVMEEMRQEGIEPDQQFDDPDFDPAKDKDEEDEDQKPRPKKEKDKSKPKDKGKKDDEEEEGDEDDDDEKDKKPKSKKEDEDKDEDEEDLDEGREKRPQRFVEPWELTRLEKKLTKSLEGIVEQIKEVVSKPDNKETRKEKEDIADQLDDVKKIADEYGLDPEPLQKLADAILSKVKLPKDITEKLESLEDLKKEKDDEKFWSKQ